MTNQLTPRERAVRILSDGKLRMLEEAGLTVVETAHLEELLTETEQARFETYATQDYELYVESCGGPSRGDHMDAIAEGKWEPNEEASRFVKRVDALERLYEAAHRCVIAGRVHGDKAFINEIDRVMWIVAQKDLHDALEELEAMERG